MRVRLSALLSVLLSARPAVRLLAIATVVLGSAALAATEAPPRTQEGAVTVVSPTLARALHDVPFAIGESLSYSVKFGFARIGSGTMFVQGPAQVRGVDVIHTMFRITGGIFFFKINDLMQSWIEPKSFASLRFWQDISEGNYTAHRRIDRMKRLASRLTWWHMLPQKGTPRSTPQRGEASRFIPSLLLEVLLDLTR